MIRSMGENEKMYRDMERRMERQKSIVNRLLRSNALLASGLLDIAEGDLEPGSMKARARRALDEAVAAATDGSKADSPQTEPQPETPKENQK